MPENDEQDVLMGAQAPVETERECFERERLSRRQALKRFGMTSAMATFALFSVDDLARMVGKAMQQRAGDNKVAAQVAQEFQNAGVAMAGGTSGSTCQHCCNQDFNDHCFCDSTYTLGSGSYQGCNQQASYDFYHCYQANCVPTGQTCTTPTGPCPTNPPPPFGWY